MKKIEIFTIERVRHAHRPSEPFVHLSFPGGRVATLRAPAQHLQRRRACVGQFYFTTEQITAEKSFWEVLRSRFVSKSLLESAHAHGMITTHQFFGGDTDDLATKDSIQRVNGKRLARPHLGRDVVWALEPDR